MVLKHFGKILLVISLTFCVASVVKKNVSKRIIMVMIIVILFEVTVHNLHS